MFKNLPFLKAFKLAKDSSTSSETLRELAVYPNLSIKVAVSLHRNCPGDVKEKLRESLGALSVYEAYV